MYLIIQYHLLVTTHAMKKRELEFLVCTHEASRESCSAYVCAGPSHRTASYCGPLDLAIKSIKMQSIEQLSFQSTRDRRGGRQHEQRLTKRQQNAAGAPLCE